MATLSRNHNEQLDFIERKPYLCTLCHKAFTEEEDLVSHVAIHTSTIDIKPMLTCEKCDMVFERSELLEEHMTIHDRKNLSFCSVCKLILMNDECGNQYHDECGQLLCAYCFLSQGKEKMPKTLGSPFILKEKKKKKVKKNKKTEKTDSANQPENVAFPELHVEIQDADSFNVDVKTEDEITPKKRKRSPKKKTPKGEEQQLPGEVINEDKKDVPLQCTYCPKTFILQHNLDKHMDKKHINVDANKCSICNKTFNRTNYLKQHMLIHTGEKPVKCPVCDKTFRQKPELTRHLRVHTGEKPYKCTECEEAYTEKIYLKRHMINAHNIGIKPFLCSMCPRSFLRKSELNGHILTHTGERPHACDQCGETYRQKYLLTRHLLLHMGIKPGDRRSEQAREKVQCNDCGKVLADKDGLRKHMRRHRGEEECHCDICGKRFCTKGTLKRHQNVHTGLKPFECDDCGKRFTQKENMIQHKAKACPARINGSGKDDYKRLDNDDDHAPFDPVHFPEFDEDDDVSVGEDLDEVPANMSVPDQLQRQNVDVHQAMRQALANSVQKRQHEIPVSMNVPVPDQMHETPVNESVKRQMCEGPLNIAVRAQVHETPVNLMTSAQEL